MIIIKQRYAIQQLASRYKLPNIYDLLNRLKEDRHNIASTDGKNIYINPEEFNERTPRDAFFILCHEFMHIVYRHTDKTYYPSDVYPNHELLNICQDVVINEFLSNKLGYATEDGLYLWNLVKCLYDKGIINSRYVSYSGQLTTKQLYEWVSSHINEDYEDAFNDLLQELAPDDFIDTPEDQIGQLPLPKEVIKMTCKALKIKAETVSNEMEIAVSDEDVEDLQKTLITANTITSIKPTEMIKFIKEYVGNNATVKGRSRTYARPSRRFQSPAYVVPGYKHYKNVNKIDVYLDTSGSMSESLVSELFTTLKTLHQSTEFNLYQFTTYIEKVDLKNKQSIYTGGGTNIQKVLDKIQTENADHCIVITDCEDNFSLKNITQPLMIFTNNHRFISDNSNVRLTYFD